MAATSICSTKVIKILAHPKNSCRTARHFDMETCSLAHQSLIILYNLGLVSLHSGHARKAADSFEITLHVLSEEQNLDPNTVSATFVASLYCNTGRALWILDDDKEDGGDEELLMFSEAVFIGKDYLGDHIMGAQVLNIQGRILTSRGQLRGASIWRTKTLR